VGEYNAAGMKDVWGFTFGSVGEWAPVNTVDTHAIWKKTKVGDMASVTDLLMRDCLYKNCTKVLG
jgi:hypothetical protein